MNGTLNNLHLCSLTPEQHQRTCNYWYTVTIGTMAYTAFETERGLYRWMRERGIELTEPLPARGTFSYQQLAGAFVSNMMMDANAFEELKGEYTKVLSNGEYTLGILTKDEDGHVVVNYLNPNVKTRQVWPYWDAAKEMR